QPLHDASPRRRSSDLKRLGQKESWMKRVFDIAISGSLLVVLSPLLILLALLVHTKLGSPVLFRQIRPGKNGKPFEMIKFRTMTRSEEHTSELQSRENP